MQSSTQYDSMHSMEKTAVPHASTSHDFAVDTTAFKNEGEQLFVAVRTSHWVERLGVLDLPDAALEGVCNPHGLLLRQQVLLDSLESVAMGVVGTHRHGLKVLLHRQ